MANPNLVFCHGLAAALADLAQQEPNLDNIPHIKFYHPITGKGMLWAGKDYTKQFVYQEQGENIFSSENIDLSKNKSYKIDNEVVLSSTELGTGITKSNIREVGRLKGLVVDGSLSVNNYLIYDANTDRLGIGTEEPNANQSDQCKCTVRFAGTFDCPFCPVPTGAQSAAAAPNRHTLSPPVTVPFRFLLFSRPLSCPLFGSVSVRPAVSVSLRSDCAGL